MSKKNSRDDNDDQSNTSMERTNGPGTTVAPAEEDKTGAGNLNQSLSLAGSQLGRVTGGFGDISNVQQANSFFGATPPSPVLGTSGKRSTKAMTKSFAAQNTANVNFHPGRTLTIQRPVIRPVPMAPSGFLALSGAAAGQQAQRNASSRMGNLTVVGSKRPRPPQPVASLHQQLPRLFSTPQAAPQLF